MKEVLKVIDEREILGKDIKIYGTIDEPLFLAKDVAEWIDYAFKDKSKGTRNVNMMLEPVDDDEKGKFIYLYSDGNILAPTSTARKTQESWFLTEDGLYEVFMISRKPIAKDFKKQIKKVLKELRTTGKVDLIEKAINNIQDEKHRQLLLEIHKLEEIMQINPNDMVMSIALNQRKAELDSYLNSKKLLEVETKIDTLSDRIDATTNLREGDMNATYVARQLQIYSKSNKPHNNVAMCLAQVLGFYVKPEGNIGYKDDYVKINLTTRGGIEVPVISYTQKALQEMKDYLDSGNYMIGYDVYKNGDKKGKFKSAHMYFEDLRIEVNETTYNLYK